MRRPLDRDEYRIIPAVARPGDERVDHALTTDIAAHPDARLPAPRRSRNAFLSELAVDITDDF